MAGMAAARRRGERLPPPPGPPERLPPPPPLPVPRLPSVVIDREKTCPLLLRVFTKVGGHHVMGDFAVRGKEPKNEFQIYTWKDATLRELSDLVKEVTPEARKRGSRLSFAFVYPDSSGRFVVRRVGLQKVGTSQGLLSTSLESGVSLAATFMSFKAEVGETFAFGNIRQLDDNRALGDLGFETGDYLDVAIL